MYASSSAVAYIHAHKSRLPYHAAVAGTCHLFLIVFPAGCLCLHLCECLALGWLGFAANAPVCVLCFSNLQKLQVEDTITKTQRDIQAAQTELEHAAEEEDIYSRQLDSEKHNTARMRQQVQAAVDDLQSHVSEVSSCCKLPADFSSCLWNVCI